jgi:hypothetical protein
MVTWDPSYRENIGPIGEQGERIALPAPGAVEKIALLESSLGRPVPLCYGRHIVGGNVIYQNVSSVDQLTTYLVALGQGEWDALETLWISGVKYETPFDTAVVHFHPGLDGALGIETDPSTANQKICSFYPVGFSPQLTFSRMAYLAIQMTPDAETPDVALDVRGIYRTKKVRTFDAYGAQVSYVYSANSAWVILDLLISRYLKPNGLVNAALTASDLARIDFPSFLAAANICAADPGEGAAWAEAHLAFTDQTNLSTALNQILMLMQGYLIDRNGKIALYCDVTRSSQFICDRTAIAENSLSHPRKDTRSLSNKIVVKYRSLVSGDVDSPRDPAKDFQTVTPEFNDEEHQDSVGRIIPSEIDIGNSTPHRANRIGRYLRNRSLYLIDQARLTLLQAGNGNNPIDLLPGDWITCPTDVDAFFSQDYEILEITDEPDGSRSIFAQEAAPAAASTLTPPAILYQPTIKRIFGIPTGASNLRILLTANDASISANEMQISINRPTVGWSTCFAFDLWFSAALPGQGIFYVERQAKPAATIEGPWSSLTLTAHGRRVLIPGRSASATAVGKVFLFYDPADGANGDLTMDGFVIAAQGAGYLDSDSAIGHGGTFSGEVIKRPWAIEEGESTNLLYLPFRIPEDLVVPIDSLVWKFKTVDKFVGTAYYITGAFRNDDGAGKVVQ